MVVAILRMWKPLLMAAAMIGGPFLGPAAQAATPGSGTMGASSAPAAGSPRSASPAGPCAFRKRAICQSVDPRVKIYANYTGKTSACTFTWKINWADGSKVQTVVQVHPADGEVLVAGHAYGARAQRAYKIPVKGRVTGSGCFVRSGSFRFTLLSYVALGDSYSSGDGASDYLPGTGFAQAGGNECLRSGHAYPVLVERALGNSQPIRSHSATFIFRACTGAVIRDFSLRQVTQDKKVVRPQSRFLGGTGGVGLVTFTMGGNDVGFGPLMTYCATRTAGEPSCQRHSQKAVGAVLAAIEPRLAALYTKIKGARGLAVNAAVLAVGYPRFFPAGQSKSCPTGDPFHSFRPSDMAWINSVIRRFDSRIAAAAKSARITYVDVYDAFAGHELCQKNADLNAVVVFPLAHHQVESFHPTSRGQKELARLAERALRPSGR